MLVAALDVLVEPGMEEDAGFELVDEDEEDDADAEPDDEEVAEVVEVDEACEEDELDEILLLLEEAELVLDLDAGVAEEVEEVELSSCVELLVEVSSSDEDLVNEMEEELDEGDKVGEEVVVVAASELEALPLARAAKFRVLARVIDLCHRPRS